MPAGAITSYVDVAQLVLYAFWIFFAGLIIYLRREDKREGYPLESDRNERAPHVPIIGFPAPPEPKVFRLMHGEADREAPRKEKALGKIKNTTVRKPIPGEPLIPTGDPMRDGVGPASAATRKDIPDRTLEGQPKIVPMRVATDFAIAERDPDPRGMSVVGADEEEAGQVVDCWVDRAEPRILYFEVELKGKDKKHVLLPVGFARIQAGRNRIRAASILGAQFTHVPQVKDADQVTRLEEDRITAYFASGHLYATPARTEPLV